MSYRSRFEESADVGGAVIVCSRRACGRAVGLGGWGGALTVIVVINNKSAHVT